MGISTKVSSSSLHDALGCYEQEQAWKYQSHRRAKFFMLNHTSSYNTSTSVAAAYPKTSQLDPGSNADSAKTFSRQLK